MADITYSVQVEYFSRGRIDPGLDAADRKAKNFAKKLAGDLASAADKFNTKFDSAVGSMISGLSSAATLAGGALAAGVGMAMHQMMKFNEQAEMAKISLAAISVGTGESSNMANGLRIASTTVAQMRKDAALLPGSFEDLQKTLTMIMPALGHAGVGTAGGEAIAAKVMTAAAIENINPQVAAREYAALIEGRATGRMPLFTKLGLGSAKEFNQLSMGERISKTNTALTKFTGDPRDPNSAIGVFANSWNAIKETAIGNVNLALGAVGGDLFERIKDIVKAFNQIGQGQRGQAIMERMGFAAEKISAALVRGFDYLIGTAENGYMGAIRKEFELWLPPTREFFSIMLNGFRRIHSAAQPILDSLSNTIRGMMSDPGLFGKLEKLGATMLAVRAGSGALSFGASAIPAISGMSGMLGGGGAMAAVAAPMMAGLSLLAISAYGAAHALMDTSSMFHGLAVSQVKDIGDKMTNVGIQVERLGAALQPVADAFGVVLLESIRAVATTMESLTWVIRETVGWSKTAFDLMAGKGFKTPEERAKEAADAQALIDETIAAARSTRAPLYSNKLFDTGEVMADKEKAAPPPNHTTHIHKVEIKVQSNQDPSRIAKATLDVIADFARRPRSSQFDPNLPFSRR